MDELGLDDELRKAGDWRADEEKYRSEHIKEVLEFISEADEPELQVLETAIAERREAISAKHEL